MAQFTVEIPDELLPGLVAEYSLVSGQFPSPEAYFIASAIEMVRQRCQIHSVGPFYVGSTPPKFNADGSPYTAPVPPVEPPVEPEATLDGDAPAAWSLPEPTAVGQEATSPDGVLWRVVQASDENGQFVSDDPETPERESLQWAAVEEGDA